jgi:zinc transporter ZupT
MSAGGNVALHRQGNTVALEVPLERFSAYRRSRNRARQCLAVTLVASFVLAVVAYVAAPIGLFLLQAVLNHKNESLERLVYHSVPEAVSFFFMLCLGGVMIYVGVRIMQHPMTA